MDRKGRTLQLSIKAKDEAETAEALAEYNKTAAEAAPAPPAWARCCVLSWAASPSKQSRKGWQSAAFRACTGARFAGSTLCPY
jgi:hypothetical protein